ncbi:major facilitator superfamily domain-containing protein [Melampsora americana]|nr:major facilitator superfamily domain-containing protein [Melampsora americana]
MSPQPEQEERTPLLPHNDSILENSINRNDEAETRSVTPLPVKQLLVLCLMRITAEPVSFTIIFPFINQMIEDLKVTPDRTQVGSYAGLIESLFAVSQLCTVLFWGRLSDRIGRKPVLLSGLIGLSVGMVAFGVQWSFVGLILARSFAGAMNGNIAVIKSTLAELTDETNQARAFALLPLTYAIGIAIGPAIGGYTAKPAEQYPSLFSITGFFGRYPYFLPCFIAGSLNMLAVVVGIFFLDETLPTKTPAALKRAAEERIQETETGIHIAPSEVTGSPSVMSLLKKPVLLVLLCFIFMAFENSAWNALVPLFSYTRIEDGGLGLSMNQIGTTLSSSGIVAVLVQTVLFPSLQRKYGTINLLRCVKLAFPICFMSLPLIGIITREASPDGKTVTPHSTLVAMLGMAFSLALKCFGNMSIVCITLLVNASAPTRESLGTINGLAQSCASLARSFGPFATGSLFAASIGSHALGGALIWIVLMLICAGGYATCWIVEEGHPSWRKGGGPRPTAAETPSGNSSSGTNDSANTRTGYGTMSS